MNDHWRQRVNERIRTVDPDVLWRGIEAAIRDDRRDLVQFVGRLNRTGRRLFRFRVPDGRTFTAIIDTVAWVPVTVLEERMVTEKTFKRANEGK